jgi:flagellar hook assembly protein FlgD
VQVELPQTGSLSVLVFTLDGDVVRVLNRAPSAAGTFFFTWDGTNAAGRPVGRGIYFIRVVGPGIDEMRKVMIIKEN